MAVFILGLLLSYGTAGRPEDLTSVASERGEIRCLLGLGNRRAIPTTFVDLITIYFYEKFLSSY